MKIDLTNKTAVVTGGSRGIGLSIAHTLGQAGAHVVILGRSTESLENAKMTLAADGVSVQTHAVDIADGTQASETMKAIVKENGSIDILVNNAGITRDMLMMRMTADDWYEVINTNLNGTYHMIKSVIRPMMKTRSGRIINISSVVGLTGNAGQANYATSKAGLVGLTKSIAKEVASRNITANVVAPGFIETDMTANLPEEIKKKYMETIPLGRFGATQDVANMVLFLASDSSSYITGQVFVVDGGMTM